MTNKERALNTYIEYMYNIYDEEAIISQSHDGVVTVNFENGQQKEFKDFNAAVQRLQKMGYRF